MQRQSPRKPPARRPRRGRRLLLLLLLLALAAASAIAAVGYAAYQEVAQVERQGTFYPGVHVDHVALHGATPQAAYDYLVARATAAIQDWQLTIRYGDAAWSVTPQDLGLDAAISQAVMDAVNDAFMVGRTEGTLLARHQAISALKDTPYHGYTASPGKDTRWLDALLAEIQAAVLRAPVDATLAFDPGRQNPVVITPEIPGQTLDTAALRDEITAMISAMTPGTITVAPQAVPPAVLAADLQNRLVLLGSFRSDISTKSTHERNLNIELGCRAFHGKVVAPDEKVSFNRWVGKRTEKNGFHPAQEIVSGAYEMGIGGGICQVSSTLYNAVVRAGLRVRERRNHSIPVQYLDMGADATVYDDRIDFVFQNNTGEPIYLIARVDSTGGGKQKSCLFQIYGRPDPAGHTYTMEHTVIEELPIPAPNITRDTKQAHVTYQDEAHEAAPGRKGYKVRTDLITKSGDAIVDRRELYVDTYTAKAPEVYVGITPR